MFFEVKKDNLQKLLNKGKSNIVMFGTPQCEVCKHVKPDFKELSNEVPDINFLYVDIDNAPNSIKSINFENLPAFAAFKKNIQVGLEEGFRGDILETLFKKLQ